MPFVLGHLVGRATHSQHNLPVLVDMAVAILSEQIINPAMINIVINGAISWLSLRNAEMIYYWKTSPIGPDLLLTGLLLPFIMTMINSRLIAGTVYKGDLDHIPIAKFAPVAGIVGRYS